MVDALLLKSLPVKDPQQLVLFSTARPGGNEYTFNYPLFERFNQANHSFAGIIASNAGRKLRMSVAEAAAGGEIEPVQAEQLTLVEAIVLELLKQTGEARKLLRQVNSRWPEWDLPRIASLALGVSHRARLIVVSCTERGRKIRIISARLEAHRLRASRG